MNYKDVKIAVLVRKLAHVELAEHARTVEAAFAKVMLANGLDPAKNYHLKDDDETITEKVPDVPPVG